MDRETPTYAGLMLSLRKYRDRFVVRRNLKLNAKPREIDVFIIDKLSDIEPIDNDIARIFERHNIIELKNPEEPLNIDVIWKGISYAAQYKSKGYDDFTNRQGVNIIQMKDITLTFLRMSKPKSLFEELKSLGYRIKEEFSGVYYVCGMVDIKMQIVVGNELKGDDFVPIRVQKNNAAEEDAIKFAKMADKMDGVLEKELTDAILQMSMTENRELYERLRKERPDVCEALREFFRDDLAAQYEAGVLAGTSAGIKQGIGQGIIKGEKAVQTAVVQNMIKRGFNNDDIMAISTASLDDIENIRQNM